MDACMLLGPVFDKARLGFGLRSQIKNLLIKFYYEVITCDSKINIFTKWDCNFMKSEVDLRVSLFRNKE